jgi:hypothetical protein
VTMNSTNTYISVDENVGSVEFTTPTAWRVQRARG